MFSQNEHNSKKRLAFVDGVHFKDEVEVPPYRNNQYLIYKVMPTIIRVFYQ